MSFCANDSKEMQVRTKLRQECRQDERKLISYQSVVIWYLDVNK